MSIPRAQVDRLGDRLRRSGTPDKDDGELFEAYRSSFDRAHHEVVGVLSSLAVSVTDAPTIATRRKTLESTIAKLRRIRIRLSRIEDIAGCRVVLDGLAEQDLLLSRALDSLDIVRRRDYRLAPDHGYRGRASGRSLYDWGPRRGAGSDSLSAWLGEHL